MGKKPEENNTNEVNEFDATEPMLLDSIESENLEKDDLETREIELIQDGITVTMLLPVEIIAEMDRLKGQDSEKWINNSFELVREAKRRINGMSNNAKNKNSSELTTCTVTESTVDIEQTIEGVKFDDEVETPFDGKLESERRKEVKTKAHWIVQDGTEMCIKIEDVVYKKMVELQTDDPKQWVNKEWDLFLKAKSNLQERSQK